MYETGVSSWQYMMGAFGLVTHSTASCLFVETRCKEDGSGGFEIRREQRLQSNPRHHGERFNYYPQICKIDPYKAPINPDLSSPLPLPQRYFPAEYTVNTGSESSPVDIFLELTVKVSGEGRVDPF